MRVVLRPGTYVLRTPGKLPFREPPSRVVRVLPARFAVVNLEIDTGIGLSCLPSGTLAVDARPADRGAPGSAPEVVDRPVPA